MKTLDAALRQPMEKSTRFAMRSDAIRSLPYSTAEILRKVRPSGPFLLRIEGGSMLPLIPPGAVVKVEPPLHPPRIGDVVVCIHASTAIVHRVVGRRRLSSSGGFVLQTKGDNSLRLDPPVAAKDVVGIVRAVHAYGEDRRLRVRPLPHLTGLWIAQISHLLGCLSGVLACRLPAAGGREPRKTVVCLMLRLFQRSARRLIYFAACDFSRRIPGG